MPWPVLPPRYPRRLDGAFAWSVTSSEMTRQSGTLFCVHAEITACLMPQSTISTQILRYGTSQASLSIRITGQSGIVCNYIFPGCFLFWLSPLFWHLSPRSFAFFATNVGHLSDRQGRAMSAEKISTLQVVFKPPVFGRTLLVVILGTAILVA